MPRVEIKISESRSGQKLICKPDKSKTIWWFCSWYLHKKGDQYDLAGHVPLGFSYTFCFFIEKPKNKISAEVTGGKISNW